MKKLFVFMAVLFTTTLFMPNIFADENYGTVTDISNADSVISGNKAKIDHNETANVTMTFDALTLKILDRNESGRPDNYAWVGFHITTPSTAKQDNAKFKLNDGEYQKIDKDGNYYSGINQEKLEDAAKKGTDLTYKYQFDWNGDGNVEQTVTLIISANKITLQDKSGNEIFTPEDAAKLAPKPNNNLDTVPKTGDTTSYTFFGIIILLIGIGVYHLIDIKYK